MNTVSEPFGLGSPFPRAAISTRRSDHLKLRGIGSAGTFARPAVAVRALHAIAVGYWAMFWSMNGLDKFLNRSDVGPLFWYGKDRADQFGEYFTRLEWSPEAIHPLLVFAGIWELAIALPLIVAMIAAFAKPASDLSRSASNWGYVLTGLTLIGFSLFDIVAGDRAELREHGLYLALMFVCCVWSQYDGAAEKQITTGGD